MFDNLFVLLGHTATAIALFTLVGVVSAAIMTEILGVAFRHGRRPRLT
jgi:hypothetical protein